MAEILGGYGDVLIQSGRGDESQKYLDDALSLSRELKNDGMVAQTLGFMGDASFYRGDLKSARGFYERGVQAAGHSTETDKKLLAGLALARVAVQEGHGKEAIAKLQPLTQKAEILGLKYIAAQCSLSLAEAMIQVKDFAHAKPELEKLLLRSDKLGLQPVSAKAHYLQATMLRLSGNTADAQDQYRQAVRILDAISKEKGAEKVLQRSDLSAMYNEANRWSQGK
jgi:Tfp pilus assembly protein PilF